jgi:hypothetical protein
MSYYHTIALAEAAIVVKGYQRDNQRHIWMHPDTRRTAKVQREENGKFFVEGVDFV